VPSMVGVGRLLNILRCHQGAPAVSSGILYFMMCLRAVSMSASETHGQLWRVTCTHGLHYNYHPLTQGRGGVGESTSYSGVARPLDVVFTTALYPSMVGLWSADVDCIGLNQHASHMHHTCRGTPPANCP
jgi:hypothetical protein